MIDDPIIPPPLAPTVDDLLTMTARDALRAIVGTGDVTIGADGEPYLVAPATPALIDALAAFEAELEDLEDDDPAEACGDDEPSLGATNGMNQDKAWRATTDRWLLDLEYGGDDVPDADAEPSLGAPENHPQPWGYGRTDGGDQTRWARGFGSMEEEQVNEDGGNIEDEGQGDTFEESGSGAGNCDDEPSLGATVAIDQRSAWADTGWAVSDGEASGTIDDLEMPVPTIAQREAQAGAARGADETLRAIVSRKAQRRD